MGSFGKKLDRFPLSSSRVARSVATTAATHLLPIVSQKLLLLDQSCQIWTKESREIFPSVLGDDACSGERGQRERKYVCFTKVVSNKCIFFHSAAAEK